MNALRFCAVAALLCSASGAGAQKKFELTVDSIMRGPALVGYQPSAPRWSGDSARIYFEWKQASDPVLKPMDTYVVNRDGSGLQKLSEDEAALAPPAAGDESRDHSRIVYSRDGDIFIYDRRSNSARRITRTSEPETNPHFTRDGKRIWYTRANNLFVQSLEDGAVQQLTDMRPPETPTTNAPRPQTSDTPQARVSEQQKKGTESQEFVKKEERELLDVVRQRAAQREEQEARRKREYPRKPFHLQARQTVSALELSPDEKLIVATFSEPGQGAKTSIVPNFIAESGYTEDIQSRTFAGDVRQRVRMALIGVADGEVKWVDHGQKPPEREVNLLQPVWSEDGSKAVFIARAADRKDRWILALDTATGKTRALFTEHDDAWLDGPGRDTLGWMKSDLDLYFQSERDGYSHLYTVPYNGGERRQLTSGKWEVTGARLSRDKTRFYLTTNENDPAEVHFYSMPAEGGVRTRLTSMPGNHRALLSPDEQHIADIYSYTNKPPELFSMENCPDAQERKLTSSPIAEFWAYPWLDAPIVHFTARDGVPIPARLYKPARFRKGGPAVIFVHGAGYLQNVHKWWSYYYREYMFHHLLMERGYLVIDIDYRGSAGYGRDWRTAIYEHMGGKDLDDHVDAAKWLVAQHGVDPKRIGIYGGSYGGFITLMALFKEPDVFAAGAALRPVTDWSHYNDPYTTSILNTPQKDPDAYKRSSPIYFAAGLKGALLICHGMVDTNVHFQDSVLLAQKLIELGKENWELAPYPAEDHGFVQPTSWADEFKRILKLFETNLGRR